MGVGTAIGVVGGVAVIAYIAMQKIGSLNPVCVIMPFVCEGFQTPGWDVEVQRLAGASG